MKTISVNIPEAFVRGLEELVIKDLYANRSEAIRVAIRDLLKRELYDVDYSNSGVPEDCKDCIVRMKDAKFIKEERSVII